MKEYFQALVAELPELLTSLLGATAITVDTFSAAPRSGGIYLFSEDGHHLYVGRTNNIRRRIRDHIGSPEKAAFAFRLARHATNKLKASYETDGSRKSLMKDPAFMSAFEDAKSRIRNMSVRYAKVTDSIRQSLLEIYAALTLDTPHNDFDNH